MAESDTRTGNGTRYRRPPDVIALNAGKRVLVVRPSSGVVDLEDVVVLEGTAHRLWSVGETLEMGEVSRVLEEMGAGEGQAREDAGLFLADMVNRGLLLVEGGDNGATSLSGNKTSEPSARSGEFSGAVTSSECVAFMRMVLEQGGRVRFRARGRSMRPLVRDGSVIEIESVPAEKLGRGEVAACVVDDRHIVAHRVVGRRAGLVLTRGDSATRLDEVAPGSVLGRVVALVERTSDGHEIRIPVSEGWRRWMGLVGGFLYRWIMVVVRLVVISPFRWSLKSGTFLRALPLLVLRLCGAMLAWTERVAARVRYRVEVLRSALMNSDEKDRDRRRLYARRSMREFTALDENVEAGVTLLEEVLVRRHPVPPGSLLVIGCGPGRECVALSRLGHSVVGIDRDEGMLELARELCESRGEEVRFETGEATDFDMGGQRFDTVVVFSGLYNMIVPRQKRLQLLACASRHLVDGGRIWVTFLTDYVEPGSMCPPKSGTFLESLNPEHQRGDRYLLNEAIHVFPHPDLFVSEVEDAGLELKHIFRDQRAYDRSSRQIRSFAVLEKRD